MPQAIRVIDRIQDESDYQTAPSADGQVLAWNSASFKFEPRSPGIPRSVAVGETLTILDSYSLVVANYFRVDGTLALEGDAVLEVI